MTPQALLALTVLTAVFACPALGIEDRADIEPNDLPSAGGSPIAWKLTPGVYTETAARPAADLNLRGNQEADVFWIGHYQRGEEFRQTRAGYERQFTVSNAKLIVSAQYASRGFVGASTTLEFNGGPDARWFGLVGLGRTNTRPYYNLNFDPNDSTLIGAGWRPDASTTITGYQIRDDRLDTGQRVTHLVVRRKTGHLTRITIDVFERAGRASPEADLFRGTGITLTYDHDTWFVRASHDPKAGFTASDMTRLAIGMRF